jgi:hypothetical protein
LNERRFGVDSCTELLKAPDAYVIEQAGEYDHEIAVREDLGRGQPSGRRGPRPGLTARLLPGGADVLAEAIFGPDTSSNQERLIDEALQEVLRERDET